MIYENMAEVNLYIVGFSENKSYLVTITILAENDIKIKTKNEKEKFLFKCW